MQLNVLYESKWLIAIQKPPGLQVEKSPHYPSLEAELEAYLLKQTPKPFIGVIHRLDRSVSGLILFAKRMAALQDLNAQFANRQITKEYLAIVENPLPQSSDTLQHWLQKDVKHKKALIFNQPKQDAVFCELSYQYIEKIKLGYLLKINLLTGKFHQIRAQLAAVGCPIVGDAKYGSTQTYLPDAIALHAWKLHFRDPFDGSLQILEAPAPFENFK